MSKCEIAFNEKEQALQIILHLFIDDLESALAAEGIEDLFICTDKEDEEAEKYIYDYLVEKFRLKINDEPAAYQFLGKEVSEDLQAVWCYLEIENIETLQALTVNNQIMTSLFDDQKNIVSVTSTAKGRKGYFLFDKGTFEDRVEF
jgi:NDP-sugar pyrophosphorylase family protein